MYLHLLILLIIYHQITASQDINPICQQINLLSKNTTPQLCWLVNPSSYPPTSTSTELDPVAIQTMPKSKAPSSSLSILPDGYTLTSSNTLCSLWSNYGSISRLNVTRDDDEGATGTATSLILKTILPPESSSSDESHLRKLISYRVERFFYKSLSKSLSGDASEGGAGGVPSARQTKVADMININDKEGALLLEDLSVEYPRSCYGSIDLPHTTAVLSWLAGFHSTFWTAPQIDQFIAPPLQVTNPSETDSVWSRGGYWYLATRADEYSSLLDAGDEYGWLLPWVEYVDKQIENEKREWKTLVHGDAKGANILFGKDATTNEIKVAMYDFQYCGLATPAVDLVYFLGTTADRKVLADIDGLLRVYYDQLCTIYERKNGKKLEEDLRYSFEVLQRQWDVAVVDWMRFMAGWGVWGNWRWIEAYAKKVVKKWEEEEEGIKP